MTRPRSMLLILTAAGACSLLPGFLVLAPNRLTRGVPVNLFACAPWWGVAILVGLLALLLATMTRRTGWALIVALGLVALAPLAAGAGAAALLRHAPRAARAELGGGFWLLLIACVLAWLDEAAAQRLTSFRRVALGLVLGAAFVAMAATGWLRPLSLSQEYLTHRAAFATAAARHALLVGLTLVIVAGAGVPLGIATWQRPFLRAPVFGVLNVVQTLPSIALFGLLLTPLTRLGLSGIGIVPAVIALVLYALLPTVRAVVSGLQGVPAAPLEAAQGLGFTEGQIFRAVRLPLAVPALIAGARVVLVQTVGLAVVAALIGAGGFGDFVFQGLGQDALDLVLLGALPATGLALFADAMLTLAADSAGRHLA